MKLIVMYKESIKFILEIDVLILHCFGLNTCKTSLFFGSLFQDRVFSSKQIFVVVVFTYM